MYMSDSVTKITEETVSLDTDILEGVSADEVKSVVDKIAAGVITNFEVSHSDIIYSYNNVFCIYRMKLFRRLKIKRKLL